MNFIRQTGDHDSFAACLAMVLDRKSLKDIYPFLGYDPETSTPRGTCVSEITHILVTLGVKTRHVVSMESLAEQLRVPPGMLRERHGLSSAHVLRQRLGSMLRGCAIVVVPDLNIAGELHAVVCYKGEVYDPSNKKQYIGAAQSLPLLEVIFIEE